MDDKRRQYEEAVRKIGERTKKELLQEFKDFDFGYKNQRAPLNEKFERVIFCSGYPKFN